MGESCSFYAPSSRRHREDGARSAQPERRVPGVERIFHRGQKRFGQAILVGLVAKTRAKGLLRRAFSQVLLKHTYL